MTNCIAVKSIMRTHNDNRFYGNSMAITILLHSKHVCNMMRPCITANNTMRPMNVCNMVKDCMAVKNTLRPHNLTDTAHLLNYHVRFCTWHDRRDLSENIAPSPP